MSRLSDKTLQDGKLQDAHKYTAVRLSKLLGVTPGTIRRWAKEEQHFPNATVVCWGYQCTRYWSLSEVQEWLEIKRNPHTGVPHERLSDRR